MPNISYTCKGEGETILFLHGWGQNKEMMLPLIEELQYKYKCVVIDLPGFGESVFCGEKSLDEYVSNLRKFLEQNDLLPKHIVGHSFGGKVALSYYLKYKDISSLSIIASPLLRPKRRVNYYFKVWMYKLKKLFNLNCKASGSEDYKNCKDEMKYFFINIVNTHFDRDVSNISIPTLLIWGDKDNKVPLDKGKKLNKKIKHSSLYVQKGGHFAYLENIQFTKLIIQQFLRRNNGV